MEILDYQVPVWGVVLLNGGYYVFAAAVGSLEAPTDASSAQYRFWFKFLNQLAANWTRAKAGKNGDGK